MSYDVSLVLTDDLDEKVEVFWRNHTSNTAVMWREAGCDLAEFDGRTAGELATALHSAISDMRSRPEHFSQWNPPNKWGSYDSTVEFLAAIFKACEYFPIATVEVSR